MPTLAETNPELFYAMFKGEPGTRKSTAALSFLPMGKQYWFSWDRKMQGILLPAQKWGLNVRDVVYDDYEDWSKAADKLKQFQTDIKGYKTLVFDSLTSCADMALRQTLKGKQGTTRSSGQQAGKQIAGIAVNELEDYNAESAALNELIALTKDIQAYHKINIILIAHVMDAAYRNTVTGQTHNSRTIVTAGKRVAAKIPAYCTEVYHFNIEKGFVEGAGGKYTCLTSHTGDDFARTALDLPHKIEFEDRSLYDGWIKGAIAKAVAYQNSLKQVVTPASNVVSSPKFTG
jgi:hypothetical protein